MKRALVLIALLAIFIGAGVGRAAAPPATQGGGGGWPACTAATNGWYFWSGSLWWRCGFNPYYGWIWVPA